MKRLLAALIGALLLLGWYFPAVAADLPIKAPVTAYITNYSWNGLWLGAYFGGAINATNSTVTDGVSAIDFGTIPKGVLGGINAGVNFQPGSQIVLGLYIEQDFANMSGSDNMSVVQGHTGLGTFSLANASNYLGAVGLRAGYLLNPASLLYAKGGFAWVGAKPDFSAIGTAKGISDTSFGWQVGGGLEHRLSANWSVKLEYDHTQAGDKQIDIPVSGGTLSSINKYRIDKAVIGLNYLF
jgi:outer membrane immunogenic protein